jgi:hypothetical protein
MRNNNERRIDLVKILPFNGVQALAQKFQSGSGNSAVRSNYGSSLQGV